MTKISHSLFFIIVLFVFCVVQSHGQRAFTVKEVIDIWNLTGSEHAKAMIPLIDESSKYYKLKRNQTLLNDLRKYVSKHPSDRLKIKLFLFEQSMTHDFYTLFKKDGKGQLVVKNMMMLAKQINDEQLLAELYVLYGYTCMNTGKMEEGLLYTLKAISIFKQIGLDQHPYINNLFMNTALALYRTENYTLSLQYSLACNYDTTPKEYLPPNVHVFLNNIIASNYNKLKNYDSAIYYYRKVLANVPDTQTVAWKHFWTTMTNGDIAIAQYNIKKDFALLPIIDTAIAGSLQFNEKGNAAYFMNTKGTMLADANKIGEAIRHWKQSLYISGAEQGSYIAKDNAYQLANAYKKLGMADSVYHYFLVYDTINARYVEKVNAGKISTINAQIGYDNLMSDITKTKEKLHTEKITKIVLLIFIVLIALIAWVLYSRKALKVKYQQSIHEQEKKQAEEKVENAIALVENFKKLIVEKNNLIENLQENLSITEKNHDAQVAKLSQYTILTEDDWTNFKNDFNTAYPRFLKELFKINKNITPAEQRLASLIYLNLDNNQISNSIGISKDSVKKAKQRLKNKFNINSEESIVSFILSL